MDTSSVSNNGRVSDELMTSLNPKTKTEKEDPNAVSQTRFLTMLTEQLKNQDPMSPMDNSQMTSQLAQISTVDGITQLNTTMQSLLGAYQTSETMQAANLVGRGVMVEGKDLQLVKGMALGGVELAGPADKVSVQILDAQGSVVKQIELGDLDAGSHNFVWDGKADGGSSAADGKYSIKISATQGGEKVTTTPLELATVTGVIRGANSVQIEVGSLGLFSMADIKQILS